MSTMAEVILMHSQISRDDKGTHCSACGHHYGYAAGREFHQVACEHVASELTKAGYGNMAHAWDEGHGIGCVDQILTVANGEQCDTPNPYRGAGHE